MLTTQLDFLCDPGNRARRALSPELERRLEDEEGAFASSSTPDASGWHRFATLPPTHRFRARLRGRLGADHGRAFGAKRPAALHGGARRSARRSRRDLVYPHAGRGRVTFPERRRPLVATAASSAPLAPRAVEREGALKRDPGMRLQASADDWRESNAGARAAPPRRRCPQRRRLHYCAAPRGRDGIPAPRSKAPQLSARTAGLGTWRVGPLGGPLRRYTQRLHGRR